MPRGGCCWTGLDLLLGGSVGVDYFFSGGFTIAPPLSAAHVALVNAERGDRLRFNPWLVDDDGATLSGPEEEMRNCFDEEENLNRLVRTISRLDHTVTGVIYGETDEAHWKYVAPGDGNVRIHYASLVYER